jgi:hypothetical protein
VQWMVGGKTDQSVGIETNERNSPLAGESKDRERVEKRCDQKKLKSMNGPYN